MAERTLQDIIDGMTPEQKDLQALIVGAAVENEVIDDDEVVAQFDALPDEQKFLIHYIVGGALDKKESEELAQANLKVNNFLSHYGVKGMKWGIRKRDETGGGSSGSSTKKAPAPLAGSGSAARLSGSTANTKENRAEARKRVRKGTATAQEAHIAALKSTGHRVANAFLGDKSYWKGIAITAGIAGAVAGSAALAPALMPAATLATIGEIAFFAGGTIVTPPTGVAVATGASVVTGLGYTAAAVGAQISSSVLGITNIVRAVRGNSRIDQSYATLGNKALMNQKAGVKRTQKILRKDGGLSKRKTNRALTQSDDLRVNQFLEHHATVSLGSMKSGA